jgi:hypothetical protein
MRSALVLAALSIVLTPRLSEGQTAFSGTPLNIQRATDVITIDADLSEQSWRQAAPIEKWYETNVGDNVEPQAGNRGYLTYDDRFFYAAFEFDDPSPGAIRAPYADRDNISGNSTDYGGAIIDAGNTGTTATLFLASASNIQYDAISDDAAGEDSAPDLFWESATKITAKGWILEMRVPFTSLRYRNVDPQTWGILLYRNYPRDRRYQFYSAQLPRGSNCFICRSNVLTGIGKLPSGSHIVAAPYVNGSVAASPEGDLGTPLVREPFDGEIGADLKWIPNADNAVDLTVNPDFSQVETDTAQITANERFALFVPEKRPFFLEGVNLFSTPIQAIYTRRITAPDWGARLTGKRGTVAYTVLVSDDQGGGSVVIPGPNESDLADQNFASTVLVARVRKGIKESFISVAATDRHARDEASHNLVVGPDFLWRPRSSDTVTGQWLFSDTRTPNRPEEADEWTGQRFSSQAGYIDWSHSTEHFDSDVNYRAFGDRFRADTGFIPQVGYRRITGSSGWTFRPTGFLTRLRAFVNLDHQEDMDGALISRKIEPAVGMDTPWSGFMQYRYVDERIRAGDAGALRRRRFAFVLQASPSRAFGRIGMDGLIGEEIDFANGRLGRGATLNLDATLHPTNHWELDLLQNQRWLNVRDPAGTYQRLFTARVSRAKSTYTFTARSFVRLIVQYVSTDRDASLYTDEVNPRDAALSTTALFAYKVNWQSVLFVGYGEGRERSDLEQLEPAGRQFFVKISYAFQR